MSTTMKSSMAAAIIAGAATLLGACSQSSTKKPEDAPAEQQEGQSVIENTSAEFILTSAAFEEGGVIPDEHGCRPDGNHRKSSPALNWSGAPEDAASFTLLMDDPDAVRPYWVHWVVDAMPAAVTSLAAGASGSSIPSDASELANSWGEDSYGGPCPPAGTGVHTYRFMLFARPAGASAPTTAGHTGDQIAEELAAGSVGIAVLTGTYAAD